MPRSVSTRESLTSFSKKGHDAITQEIGRRDRRLAIIEFCKRHFRIGVDEGLLLDPANPFHVPEISARGWHFVGRDGLQRRYDWEGILASLRSANRRLSGEMASS